MKKHPIDELFATKLSEHRQEPSQRAFDRFQERLDDKYTQKRKLTPWYFGAAAGLVIGSFGLYLMQDETTNNQSFAINKSVQSETEVKKAIAKQAIQTLSQIKVKTEKNPNNSIEKQEVSSLQSMNNVESVIENKSVIENLAVEIKKEDELKFTINDDSREVVSNGQIIPVTTPSEVVQQPDSDIILTYEVESIPEERLRRFDEEPIGLAQAIQFEEDYFLHKNDVEKEEPSFLAKIANQFKHIKNGESLSFRELRLRPRDLIAKADSFFKNEIGIDNKTLSKNRNHVFGN